MAQAKTLTARELRKILDTLAVNRYTGRNRLMLLMTHWSGMRVGEVAALSIGDVRNADGTVKPEIRLDAKQTKGNHARTVFVNDRLRKEIASYLKTIVTSDPSKPLFKTQKRQAFSANTLCQTLNVSIGMLASMALRAIPADVSSSLHWRASASACVSWLRWLGTRASRRRRPIST